MGLVIIGTLPRLLALAVKPEKVYRLYGFPYSVHRASCRLTNSQFFTTSSATAPTSSATCADRLRMHRPIQQTGSNFGTLVEHENPFPCSIGSGTMVADGLSIINADFSSTSFRVVPRHDRSAQLPG